jgi:hypothetical protein
MEPQRSQGTLPLGSALIAEIAGRFVVGAVNPDQLAVAETTVERDVAVGSAGPCSLWLPMT